MLKLPVVNTHFNYICFLLKKFTVNLKNEIKN